MQHSQAFNLTFIGFAGRLYFKLFDTFAPVKSLCLYLLMLASRLLFSQADTMQLYQAYPSFSNPAKAEWTAFENSWYFYEYPKLQAKASVKKLSCSHCESFYANVYLEINNAGKIVQAGFVEGRACGRPMKEDWLGKDFCESLLKSPAFRHIGNKVFIARFGHVLKC